MWFSCVSNILQNHGRKYWDVNKPKIFSLRLKKMCYTSDLPFKRFSGIPINMEKAFKPGPIRRQKGTFKKKPKSTTRKRQLLSRLVWGAEQMQNWTPKCLELDYVKDYREEANCSSQKSCDSFQTFHSRWDPACIKVSGALYWLTWDQAYILMTW